MSRFSYNKEGAILHACICAWFLYKATCRRPQTFGCVEEAVKHVFCITLPLACSKHSRACSKQLLDDRIMRLQALGDVSLGVDHLGQMLVHGFDGIAQQHVRHREIELLAPAKDEAAGTAPRGVRDSIHSPQGRQYAVRVRRRQRRSGT